MGESSTWKGKVLKWIRWPLSLAILGYLFYRVDFSQFIEPLASIKPEWALLAFALVVVDQVVVGVVWRNMLLTKGHNVPLGDTMRIIFASDFLGIALPSSVGSDVVKMVGLSKYIKNGAEAMSSMVALRASGIIILFSMAAVTAFLFSDTLPDKEIAGIITTFLLIGFVLGVAGLLLARPILGVIKGTLLKFGLESLHTKLKETYDAFVMYVKHKDTMFMLLVAGIFLQVSKIIFSYLISLALGMDVTLVAFFIFVPIITAITMVPVSVAGVGVREGGYVLFFQYAGVAESEALALSLCGFGIMLIYSLFSGVIYGIFGFPSAEKLDDLKGTES